MASSAGSATSLVVGEIARLGPISFARFMELALYDPAVGYYAGRRAGPGRDADFLTSPEIHPAFSGLIAAQLFEMWEALERPRPFWLIELGPGSGRFARDALDAIERCFPPFAAAVHLALVERSSCLREKQARVLARWRSRVEWIESSLDDVSPLGAGCVFANEFLDALPFHRVVMRGASLRERYVGIDGGRLVDVEGPLSVPEIFDQIRAGGGRLEDGHEAEVSLSAPAWLGAAQGLVSRGYHLLFDYGEPADLLYGARHPRGTLRCYRYQVMSEDPLDLPGGQDITAHVDLSAITRAAEARGARLLAATTQSALLARLGLPTVERILASRTERRAHAWAHRRALSILSDRRELGGIKALLFGKGVPDARLSGFAALHSARDYGEAIGDWCASACRDPATRWQQPLADRP